MDDQERREQIEKLLFGRQNPEKLERQWFVFPAISRWLILRRPEIALFPNEAEQAKAVHALEREPGRVLHWILGWMISLFVMASAFLVMVRLLRPPEWVRMGALGPMILMGGSAYFLLMRHWRAGKFLRNRLLECGVPICVQCGYCLRGVISKNCPECGRRLEEHLVKMIQCKTRECETDEHAPPISAEAATCDDVLAAVDNQQSAIDD